MLFSIPIQGECCRKERGGSAIEWARQARREASKGQTEMGTQMTKAVREEKWGKGISWEAGEKVVERETEEKGRLHNNRSS